MLPKRKKKPSSGSFSLCEFNLYDNLPLFFFMYRYIQVVKTFNNFLMAFEIISFKFMTPNLSFLALSSPTFFRKTMAKFLKKTLANEIQQNIGKYHMTHCNLPPKCVCFNIQNQLMEFIMLKEKRKKTICSFNLMGKREFNKIQHPYM